MDLKPVDNSLIPLIAGWMADKENYQWLDFGCGRQILEPSLIALMTQRDMHHLRVFTADSGDADVGLVALSDINKKFRTATLWYLLGDKRYARQGYTTRAVARILSEGFNGLGLKAVNAWAVEQNVSSIRVLSKNNFQLIGRQRKCHYVDDQCLDRLLFDLMACEYQGI